MVHFLSSQSNSSVSADGLRATQSPHLHKHTHTFRISLKQASTSFPPCYIYRHVPSTPGLPRLVPVRATSLFPSLMGVGSVCNRRSQGCLNVNIYCFPESHTLPNINNPFRDLHRKRLNTLHSEYIVLLPNLFGIIPFYLTAASRGFAWPDWKK